MWRIREGSASLFGLAPGGVCRIPVSPSGLVRSYRTVSPLPGTMHTCQPFRVRPWRFFFCGTFLRVTPTGSYPAPRSMEPGLSSPHLAVGSDHLAFFFLEYSVARQRAHVGIWPSSGSGTKDFNNRHLAASDSSPQQIWSLHSDYGCQTMRRAAFGALGKTGTVCWAASAGQGLAGAPC